MELDDMVNGKRDSALIGSKDRVPWLYGGIFTEENKSPDRSGLNSWYNHLTHGTVSVFFVMLEARHLLHTVLQPFA